MFEAAIIGLLLIAMLGSKQPYQFAIILVVVTAVFLRPIEAFGLYWAESLVNVVPGLYLTDDPRWIPADLMFIFQSFMAGILILYTFALRYAKERRFFLAMAAFILFANMLIPAYRFEVLIKSFETYSLLYHVTAILQVLTVFYYSDGITKLIGNLWDSFLSYDSSISSVRR